MYTDMAKALVFEVCEVLKCDPRYVRSVVITPRSLEVEVFKLNEDGAKYLENSDIGVQRPAIQRLSLPFSHVEPEKIRR